MRVVIDARELCGRPTGVGRYVSRLLDAWAASDRARRHEWHLVAHAPIEGASRWPADVHLANGAGGTAWEQFVLPRAIRAHRPDVFFAPGYTAPATVAAPMVLTIHDVSFFAHPEWFSFHEGTRRRLLSAWSARRARAVITISQFSRAEIQRYIGINAGRIRVITPGVGFGERSHSRPNERANVLYVGSILARRRVDRLIAAFNLAAARVPDAYLDIVGENRDPAVDLDALRRQSPYADRINLQSFVDDETLAALYRNARVFAFLSEYEGFGLTPIEALVRGVPPVLLDTPIAREVCGEAARFVSPAASDQDVATALVELLTSRDARQSLLDHAPAVLGRFDWTRTADDTLSVLEEVALGR